MQNDTTIGTAGRYTARITVLLITGTQAMQYSNIAKSGPKTNDMLDPLSPTSSYAQFILSFTNCMIENE